jgi:Zn-dependent M28 family amino/carboxypeptidase
LFKDGGFEPITHEGDYRAMEMIDIELGLSIDIEKEVIDCYNIIGILPGTDPELSHEYLTVGAHLDHLGRDGEIIYYGANDNASSCVLILEVANVLAKNPLKRSVVFILFTAEEIGHFGSLHYVAHPAVPHDQVRLNINLEQIGAKTRNVDGIWAIGPASEEATFLSIGEKVTGIELGYDDIESQVNVISGSDTLSFYLKQHPAIILGSGGFPEHHQPSDNIDLIDFNHLYRATLFVKAYIEELGNN